MNKNDFDEVNQLFIDECGLKLGNLGENSHAELHTNMMKIVKKFANKYKINDAKIMLTIYVHGILNILNYTTAAHLFVNCNKESHEQTLSECLSDIKKILLLLEQKQKQKQNLT